ncbi:magnesium chelatase subunit D [Ideonella sp. DXS29W]|uniref:Magnesium chelatase subunit D n=1 Tax=Ideonella lacteola TaxID=2984193 RepID=A0ABU9BS26_9BURK
MPGTHEDAAWAAALCALDPCGLGGVVLRAAPGPARDQWLQRLAPLLPAGTPLRRMPAHIDDERLLGGLDLAATLRQGQPVLRRGLLAEADGGLLVLAMAERLAPAQAARVAAALDQQSVTLQREGLSRQLPARLGIVALDEGDSEDERVPKTLGDRLAIQLTLPDRADPQPWPSFDIPGARARLPHVATPDALVEALCEATLSLGIGSARAPWLALRVARGAAALRSAPEIKTSDIELAARLVLGPRATRAPCPPEAPPTESSPPSPDTSSDMSPDTSPDTSPLNEHTADRSDPTPAQAEANDATMLDRLLQAAVCSLPPGLLWTVAQGSSQRAPPSTGGRHGPARLSLVHGRPVGAVRADLRSGARMDLLQTLRAAAPWQPLRRREASERSSTAAILVRREDFRIRRFSQMPESTTIFAVDASGSQALHRLAEAKGAVELLLADCYVRRDRVALVAFRGTRADLLLPPTRSLVRAKRSLAGLPGGGGTPLAAGIDSARSVAEAVQRLGGSPLIVLLTDGKANVTRQGQAGRAQAQADAISSAQAVRRTGLGALVLDSAPQPGGAARDLAEAMGARYLALPHADARALAVAVNAHRSAASVA